MPKVFRTTKGFDLTIVFCFNLLSKMLKTLQH